MRRVLVRIFPNCLATPDDGADEKTSGEFEEQIDNIVTYCTHGLTNAVTEGINSKIMSKKRRVGVYRNIENSKTAMLFYCGGLDLDPR